MGAPGSRVVAALCAAALIVAAWVPANAEATASEPSAAQVTAAASQPLQLWAATHEPASAGGKDTVPVDMAVGPDGGVSVTGSIDFSNGIETVSYDASGQLRWSQTWQQSPTLGYYAAPRAIVVGADGRVYVAGRTSDPYEDTGGTPVLPSIRPTIFAYSPSGDLLWTARYSDPEADADYSYFYDIALDQNGNVYATGDAYGHFVTVSYGPSGDQRWVREYVGDLAPPHSSQGAGMSVAVGTDGNVYVAGTTMTNPRSGEIYPATIAATVAYDANGVELWKRSYDSGQGTFLGGTIATDPAGDAFVAARYFTNDSNGKVYRYALLSYDSQGSLRWLAQGTGYVNAVAASDEGNAYLTSGDVGTWAFDTSGALRWHDGVNGADVVVDAAGNVYVVGDQATTAHDRAGAILWQAPYATSVAVGIDGAVYVAYPTPSESNPAVKALGTAKYAQFDIAAPASVSLGSVLPGVTATALVHLVNDGSPGLTISDLALSGGTDFTVSSVALPVVLPAQGVLDVLVSFTPSEPGMAAAALTVSSNDPDQPQQTIELSGTGLPRPQSIAFGPLSARIVGAGPFAVSATATSGLPVLFSTRTPSVCSVAAATVTVLEAGACTVRAEQAGNSEWAAATPVDRSFVVGFGISQLSPPAKTAFQPGSTIPVKFRLTDAGGRPISNAMAVSLGCSVRVIFGGGTPQCANYDAATKLFSVNIKTPTGLQKGTRYPITVAVIIGAVTVATATTSVVAR